MTESPCSRCGSPLADGVLADQCPRCLGALAFGLAESPADPAGGREGDYEFLRELGRGGIGVVYEARQRSLNRRVAVKLLLAGAWARPGFEPRFRAEAEAAARLRHPGIVAIHEIGERDGHPFLAMELVDGPSLADVVRSQPLSAGRAARLVRLVAEAIAHAHRNGVLHRDLKPSNILLDEGDRPRVTDFGVAKLLDAPADLTRTGELIGSPNYLPPEAVAGHSSGIAGDVYALGAVLYQLLTARPPFVADTVAATLQQVLHTEPVPPARLNESVPRDLGTICLKCLRKDPRQRYAGAAELAADLARFEAGRPVLARPVSRSERLARWGRRNPALAAVSAALALTAVLGFAGVLAQWRRAESNRAAMAENLYAADVAAAATAANEGNLGRARELLLRQAPSRDGAGTRVSPGDVPGRGPAPARPPPSEFTWRLLWARCQGDELATLGTHPWIVTCVAVSPDGRWIASGSQDQPDDTTNSLKLWRREPEGSEGTDAPTGRSLPSSNTIWSVAFTADSRTLASAGANGVHFWDVASGRLLPGYPPLPGQELALGGDAVVASPNHPFFDAAAPEPLRHLDLVTRTVRVLPVRGRHPALSSDGRRLAVLDSGRNIQVHDLETGRLLFTVATNHLVFRLRFSPDDTRLAAAGRMTAAKVWDLASAGAPPRVFRSAHNVWDAAFTPDGATLITTTSHQQIELWDANTATRRASLVGHDNEVWTAVATPDGRQLVSGGKDRTVRLWSLEAERRTPVLPLWRHARPAFSPDGSRLLTYAQTNGRGAATVWSLEPIEPGRQGGSGKEGTAGTAGTAEAAGAAGAAGARRAAVSGGPSAVVSAAGIGHARALGTVGGYPRGFAPDGLHLLFFRDDRPALDWRVVASGAVRRTVELSGAPTNLVLAEFALAGDLRSFACPDEAGVFGRWSTEDGRKLGAWESGELSARIRAEFADDRRPHRLFRGWAASRTGRWLAVGPRGAGGVVLADFETGAAVALRGHRDDVAALAFAPDDRWLATGSVDGTIRLWEVPGGRPVATLPGHLESVEAVAFSADGLTLASVNPGIEVTFWHLPTRRELARLPHPEAGYHLVFSPDGRRLALGVTEGNLETDPDRVEVWEAP